MSNKYLVSIFVACVLAGAMSYRALNPTEVVEQDVKAAYLKGGEFVLQGAKGQVRLSDFEGNPVVLYFGFTHCPDVCPLGLTVIRDALKNEPRFKDVQALFVTLDPARDTVSRLEEYLDFFHPNLMGLSGNLEQIQEVAGKYGTYFAKGKVDEHGNYSVDHTAYFYLIDKTGRLMRVLDHNTKAQGLATALEKLL